MHELTIVLRVYPPSSDDELDAKMGWIISECNHRLHRILHRGHDPGAPLSRRRNHRAFCSTIRSSTPCSDHTLASVWDKRRRSRRQVRHPPAALNDHAQGKSSALSATKPARRHVTPMQPHDMAGQRQSTRAFDERPRQPRRTKAREYASIPCRAGRWPLRDGREGRPPQVRADAQAQGLRPSDAARQPGRRDRAPMRSAAPTTPTTRP